MFSIFTNAPKPSTMERAELEREVNRLSKRLVDVERQLSTEMAHVSVLQRNRHMQPIVPHGDIDYGYECPNVFCHTPLIEDYTFCPGCGAEIDWNGYIPSCDEDYDWKFDR